MIAELGSLLLTLALTLSLAQAALSALGRRRPVLAGAGEGAAMGAFLACALAYGALIYAFVTSDFSVENVAQHSHPAQPLPYKVSAAWGSHEGSMVLWCTVLTLYGAAVALFGRRLPASLKASTLAVQGLLGVMFLAFTVFTSNPLLRLVDAPAEGSNLNPTLQDPLLAIHPPFLYFGYVGFSVVFSLSVAALIEGRVDAAWARWVRPWTLAAWSFLTVGITLGAYWAYYELGWGGWWAWDAVENVSFMPWLVGAALLHSAVVTEKRGALPGWTVFLGLCGFTFSLIGAFIVRSGVLSSVHSFAVDPERGAFLLIIMAIASGAGFALFAWRAGSLAPGGAFAPVSRESTIVLNNILLSAAAATVLLGTLYPLLIEALTGKAITVGTPYYNLTFTPLMAVLAVILPAGPLLAWKRGDARGVSQRLIAAALAGLTFGAIFLLMVSPRSLLAAVGLALGIWLVAGSLVEIAERIRLFKVPGAEVWRRLKGLPRGAYGMSLAHIGLGIFVLGATYQSVYKVERVEELATGGKMDLGRYELTLTEVKTVDGPNFVAEQGQIAVLDRTTGKTQILTPERRHFTAAGIDTSEVALATRGLNQVYVVFGEQRTHEGQPVWVVSGYVHPWIMLIFIGPFMMAAGGVLSLSDRRLRMAVGAKRA